MNLFPLLMKLETLFFPFSILKKFADLRLMWAPFTQTPDSNIDKVSKDILPDLVHHSVTDLPT